MVSPGITVGAGAASMARVPAYWVPSRPRTGRSSVAAESPAGVLIETFTPRGSVPRRGATGENPKTDAQWHQQLSADASS